MHIHILGICGTFMGGIALLARSAGHQVTGCDANVYPPMSTQLASEGIALTEGFSAEQINIQPDLFVVGNAISRGNPLLEAILDRNLPYISGPQWLADNILHDRWVLAVAGTHGKTTTTSILAWILEFAGLSPSFLIGGVPGNFGVSARLTDSPFFVIEADEYDAAFCDKRSKFVHYRPRTIVLNNLEFDHADIFADLAAIETQFHHLVRTVPGNGLIVANRAEPALTRVLDRGCWTEVAWFNDRAGDGWQASQVIGDARFEVESGGFEVRLAGNLQGQVPVFALPGEHNRANALAALVAARHAGVSIDVGIAALAGFNGVKRRLEVRGVVRGVTVIDDFAHHPTAIKATLDGLRQKVGAARIFAVLEPRSNTMKLGVMAAQLASSLELADQVICYANNLGWDVDAALKPLGERVQCFGNIQLLIESISNNVSAGDYVVIMSNGSFAGVHELLLQELGRAVAPAI
ncbi:MAG TPA: UDP-N-acetylmuramate:L-alanyl-gamma-D-glutamyl-meso-diaminopimelate ligase [Rugosibacter sp.]|nr:UDP-N-acetylmuramate:L-alanyl-gamma-D-glutamyl-meso-diaminopimelate ligase [Rugosibacter sp.]HQQ34905.1 UDP-N-acetylmuramate:L-alanyl-gamma-D-glutamyl-meso-diaminopimelate ligase [Rugosibacter sp.]